MESIVVIRRFVIILISMFVMFVIILITIIMNMHLFVCCPWQNKWMTLCTNNVLHFKRPLFKANMAAKHMTKKEEPETPCLNWELTTQCYPTVTGLMVVRMVQRPEPCLKVIHLITVGFSTCF